MTEPASTTDLKSHNIQFTDEMWEAMKDLAATLGTNVGARVRQLCEQDLREHGRWKDSMASKAKPTQLQRAVYKNRPEDGPAD